MTPNNADKEIAIRFSSVSFSYGDVEVLANTSFHIHKGEFVAIIGPNGSGKTTVLKLLFGLEMPSSGSIEIFGADSRAKGNSLPSVNLAYVPQHMPADQMFPITVHGIVRMGLLRPLKSYSRKNSSGADRDICEAMEKTGIAELALRPYSSLSGGQKRRALVARALAARPDILVLDEPTANMDIESETRLYETLGSYKGKTTIIIVTHDTEFVTSLTDRVLCLGDESHSVVQHRMEAGISGVVSSHHGGHGKEVHAQQVHIQQVRVLHDENISADGCCE